jgi:hypothetical protein
MWGDVIVGVLSAFAQFLTAWLGWQVTMKPLTSHQTKKKRLYKLSFLIAGILGIAAVATSTIRSTRTNERLERALGFYRATLENRTPDPTVFSLDPMVPGLPVSVSISKRNTGFLDATHVRGYALAQEYEASRNIEDICSDLEDRLFAVVQSGKAKESAVPAGGLYQVKALGGNLSPDKVKGIREGTIAVYVAQIYTYSDQENHHYEWRLRHIVSGSTEDCGAGDHPWRHKNFF